MFLQTFQENEKLQNFFSMLSTNVAENGAHFVSTLEGYKIIFKWIWQQYMYICMYDIYNIVLNCIILFAR